MRSSYDDIDSIRERFFGWWPRRRTDQIFLTCNLLFFFTGIFIWPWLPAFRIGLFPAPYIWYLVLTVIGILMWGIYCNKYWFAWEDDIPGENEKGESMNG